MLVLLDTSYFSDFSCSSFFKRYLIGVCEQFQVLNQLEAVIKRDYLSADYETTEELLCFCDSRSAVNKSNHPGSVTQLPWIPKTTAAAALRLFELDASIFYTPSQKAESHVEKKVEALPVSASLSLDPPLSCLHILLNPLHSMVPQMKTSCPRIGDACIIKKSH